MRYSDYQATKLVYEAILNEKHEDTKPRPTEIREFRNKQLGVGTAELEYLFFRSRNAE